MRKKILKIYQSIQNEISSGKCFLQSIKRAHTHTHSSCKIKRNNFCNDGNIHFIDLYLVSFDIEENHLKSPDFLCDIEYTKRVNLRPFLLIGGRCICVGVFMLEQIFTRNSFFFLSQTIKKTHRIYFISTVTEISNRFVLSIEFIGLWFQC